MLSDSNMVYNKDRSVDFIRNNKSVTNTINLDNTNNLQKIIFKSKIKLFIKGLKTKNSITSISNISFSSKNELTSASRFINIANNNTNSNTEEKNPHITVKSMKTMMIKTQKESRYGPFLNDTKIKLVEIKNPKVKNLIEKCEGYGPYYSHCPVCNNKNLGFFKDLRTDDAVKILTFIKKSKDNV